MKDFSYITNSHPSYIENLYRKYVEDPSCIEPDLLKFFEGFDFAISLNKTNGATEVLPEQVNGKAAGDKLPVDWIKEINAYRMILGYRNKGHLIADTNPIRQRKDRGANLDIEFFKFTEEDLDKKFYAGNFIGLGTTTLRNIIDKLKEIYAGHIGVEFKYISNQEKVGWITSEMENNIASTA